MSEMLYSPEQGERELLRIVEEYRILPIATAEVYGYFDVDGSDAVAQSREATRNAFLSDENSNPNLAYPKLQAPETSELLATSEHQVLDLMKDAVRIAHDDVRLRALEDILRTAYLNIAMVQIAGELQNVNLTREEKLQKAELFNLANDEVYGRLAPEDFYRIVHDEVDRADQVISRPNTSDRLSEIAGDYKTLLPAPVNETGQTSEAPDEAILNAIREVVEVEYADLLALVSGKKDEEVLSLDELVALFEAAHITRNTQWQVRVVQGKTNIESKQSEKATLIGAKRKPMTRHEAAKLLLHENGMHVERRERGDSIGDPLFAGLGLAGYADVEEGLGVALEEAWDGQTRESGTQYYLALGLARGLDGKPRDFRNTFEIMWRREVLKRVEKKELDDELINKARQQAYVQCTRIFRGTPCDIPGLVYTKDQAYFKGNRQAWSVLSEIAALPDDQRLGAFRVLTAAKYDPTNELHVTLIQRALSESGD